MAKLSDTLNLSLSEIMELEAAEFERFLRRIAESEADCEGEESTAKSKKKQLFREINYRFQTLDQARANLIKYAPGAGAMAGALTGLFVIVALSLTTTLVAAGIVLAAAVLGVIVGALAGVIINCCKQTKERKRLRKLDQALRNAGKPSVARSSKHSLTIATPAKPGAPVSAVAVVANRRSPKPPRATPAVYRFAGQKR